MLEKISKDINPSINNILIAINDGFNKKHTDKGQQ